MADHPFAVVGAGIGGLTAALSLARDGHPVTLVERRTGFTEVGAGLQLSPNASRILIAMGLGAALRRVAGEPEQVVVRAIRNGRELGRIALGSFMRERFGSPYWVVHRADLQRILLDAVRSQASIRMLMGRTADGAVEDADGVTLALTAESAGRESIRARAVIGADGLGSRLRAALGVKGHPVFRGYVAWRATIPRDRVPPALAANETGLWLGPGGHVVHYPVSGGRSLNVVAIQRSTQPVEGWAAPGAGPDLTAHYRAAAPLLLDLLESVDNWLLWSLFDLPATKIAAGHVALLGDAAHPVLPFLAQGAALAIEDTEALAGCLRESPDIPSAFRAYAAHRRDRVRRVQAQARRNGRIYHMGSVLGFARDAILARTTPQAMAERYAWLYGY